MQKSSKILIVGQGDILEQALQAHLVQEGFSRVVSSQEHPLDVFHQAAVEKFFEKENPEYVFLASMRSGGIEANQKYPAEFLYANLASQNHVIQASYEHKVKKLLFFASSCVYPKICPQPMQPQHLLTGPLEPTNEAYSVAKIAGIKMCQSYRRQYGFPAIVGIPATLYGPGENHDLQTAHVMGALMAKFAHAIKAQEKQVVVWGTGNPRREFLFIEDFVKASTFLMERYDGEESVHIGCGEDVSIKDLAKAIGKIVGFQGEIIFDQSKPDGAPRKLLDSSLISRLGWKPQVSLEEGIRQTWKDYKEN
ncbi:MAG: GDP-L-fucose synthase [Candidatus Omnitrophica bacterium]|nr:GDP-L-fucose synthase [Candidatus Omnitrophota bacterium]